MVSGHAGLQRGEHKHLAVFGNAPDGPSPVTYIEVLLVIESDAGGDAHAFGVGIHGAIGRYPVDRTLVARGDIHLSFRIEGDTGGVHEIGKKGLDVVVGIDPVDRYRNLLASRARKSNVNVAFRVDGRVGNRM